MEKHPPTRESLLRYLLNEIDQDERERTDTLLICDEDYHAAFQEVEYDLQDALNAGELSPQEADRARRALRPATRFASPPSCPALVPSPNPARTFETPKAGPQWLRSRPIWLAAAALVLVTLAVGTRSLRTHRADPITQSHADSAPVTPAPTEPETVSPPATELPAPKTAPLAILLLPGVSRSPHTLHLPIPRDAAFVRIDWPSTSSDAKGNNYQLQVVTDAGKVSCRTGGTALRGTDPPVIRFLCPARDVPTGVDFMRITALPADPDVPLLLEVTVSVERKPASAG